MQNVPVIQYNSKSEKADIESRWWLKGEGEKHEHVIGCCRAIDDRQTYRRRRNVMHARMYSNLFLNQLSANIYAKPSAPTAKEVRVTLNVVKAAIDTVSAKIAKNKPRPLFLTTQGNFEQRQRAKKLTQYVEGVFRDACVYENGQKAFRDGGIFGTGSVKLIPEENRISSERVLPDEIIVDDTEALYGEPRTLYQRRYMHRDVVASLWGDTPEKRAKIAECQHDGETNQAPEKTEQSDMLYVVEAWHLRSADDAKDGRHVIVIPNVTLYEEEYEKDYLPIFMLYWTPPVLGFYGSGIVEEIAGIQIEINKILRDIQQAQHRMCAPQIWIENSTHVVKPITNEIGAIYRFTGQPPTFYSPSAMSSEVYKHVWELYRRAFEIVGVSEMAATLRKPVGLESRAALREYNEIETERFALIAQAYERFYMRIAEAIIDMSRDLYESKNDLAVNVPGKKFIETIEWKDVDMEEDNYVMEVYPTALLPNTPSGKLDRVQEMLEASLIDRGQAMTLLDFPDIENVVNLETASFETISMMLDDIVYKGEFRDPEPFMDLGKAIKMAQNTYLRMMQEDLPDERQEMLLRFIEKCMFLMNKSLEQGASPAEAVAAQAPPGGPPAPQALGGAPGAAAAPPQTGQQQGAAEQVAQLLNGAGVVNK